MRKGLPNRPNPTVKQSQFYQFTVGTVLATLVRLAAPLCCHISNSDADSLLDGLFATYVESSIQQASNLTTKAAADDYQRSAENQMALQAEQSATG